MSERYEINFGAHRILIISEHSEALKALRAAGLECPTIPSGCNTVLFPFTTKGGARALAINQKGFIPVASDNEQEVNGCLLYVLGESLGNDTLDDAVLL